MHSQSKSLFHNVSMASFHIFYLPNIPERQTCRVINMSRRRPSYTYTLNMLTLQGPLKNNNVCVCVCVCIFLYLI